MFVFSSMMMIIRKSKQLSSPSSPKKNTATTGPSAESLDIALQKCYNRQAGALYGLFSILGDPYLVAKIEEAFIDEWQG